MTDMADMTNTTDMTDMTDMTNMTDITDLADMTDMTFFCVNCPRTPGQQNTSRRPDLHLTVCMLCQLGAGVFVFYYSNPLKIRTKKGEGIYFKVGFEPTTPSLKGLRSTD